MLAVVLTDGPADDPRVDFFFDTSRLPVVSVHHFTAKRCIAAIDQVCAQAAASDAIFNGRSGVRHGGRHHRYAALVARASPRRRAQVRPRA